MRGLIKVGLIFALAVFLAYQLMQYIEREQRRMFPGAALSLPTSLSLESIQSTESSLRLIFLHRKGRTCQVDNCKKLSRREGLCTMHVRERHLGDVKVTV